MSGDLAEALMQEAHGALADDDLKRARALAKQLKRMRHSGYFEILALCSWHAGARGKAIRIARDGVNTCPVVWDLWDLLGDLLTREKRFDEAFAAFEQGIIAAPAGARSLELSLVAAFLRADQGEAALARISQITDSGDFDPWTQPKGALALQLKLDALRMLGRSQDAVSAFEAAANVVSDDTRRESLSPVWVAYANALNNVGRRQDAEWAALQAARFRVQNLEALDLIRQLRRGTAMTEVRLFKLMVHGLWTWRAGADRGKRKNFVGSCEVFATNEAEALDFIAELQPEDVTDLTIEEIEEVGRYEETKGVSWANGYLFYEEAASANGEL